MSFGETCTLSRDTLGDAWWEIEIQARVFAVFDLDAPSSDLVNADYVGAVVLGSCYDRFSALVRLAHQSSHLGNECLLRNRVNRINLRSESIDLKLSYEFFGDVLRLYAGGGYLFHRDLESLHPGSPQWGIECRSPWPGPDAWYRPIADIDGQHREENNWHVDVSLRTGVEIAGVLGERKLLLEYFRGYPPDGQFYREKVDYLGVGTHFHF